jgi:hypothetical protein
VQGEAAGLDPRAIAFETISEVATHPVYPGR